MRRLIALIQKYWLALTLLVLAAITILSLLPAPSLPPVPGTDKTHHFIAYAALTFSVALARPKNWLLIAFFFIAWSGAIEIIQPYVNRYGEWLDLAANAGGVACGILLAKVVNLAFPMDDKKREETYQ
ncbi:VanZ family protein [Vibrio sp. D404a]|uniref:VanZ family protein n=1 Tax=unclassified Vibrio TaxID=2614977 RepID=UPI002556CEEC|nr:MULTISPECIES: VanZ family protein [unclassified Vibrio]MDK9736412.1 VanZ family protein [Vibrio sp. D404a]MDK9796034.1 VanZ family protein [Vibrio sp. D449a]